MIQLALGIRSIHRNGIIHRDLKPANILLNENYSVAKICDFGISLLVEEIQPTHQIVGTSFYIAPEVWNESKYSFACDVFSFGCVIYEMMNLSLAFYKETTKELRALISKRKLKKLIYSYSTELLNLVTCGIVKDPEKRISADKIRETRQLFRKPKSLKFRSQMTQI